MEPVIVVVKEIKNGKIQLTEDELKTIVRRAYSDGYWDGKKTNYWYGGITYTNSTGTPPEIHYTTTGDPPQYNPNTITCSNSNMTLNQDLPQSPINGITYKDSETYSIEDLANLPIQIIGGDSLNAIGD